jgi:RNA polymerase sigma factor for flagellar operon FliA
MSTGSEITKASSDSTEVRALMNVAIALVPAIVESVRAQFTLRLDHGELRSFGHEGAVVAARTYDAALGTAFTWWASLRIRAAIFDGLRATGSLPRSLVRRLRALQAANGTSMGLLLDHAGSTPNGAKAADARISDHLAAMATAYAAGSLFTSSEGFLHDVRDERESPEEHAQREELRTAVRAAIAERPEHERTLLERFYYDGVTLSEAAGGVSRAWASRLHARALEGVAKTLVRKRVVARRIS